MIGQAYRLHSGITSFRQELISNADSDHQGSSNKIKIKRNTGNGKNKGDEKRSILSRFYVSSDSILGAALRSVELN